MATSIYLDASTKYVTDEDMAKLRDGYGPLYTSYCTGAFIFMPLGENWHKTYTQTLGFSDKFIRLLDYAADRNFPLIHLSTAGDDSIAELE